MKLFEKRSAMDGAYEKKRHAHLCQPKFGWGLLLLAIPLLWTVSPPSILVSMDLIRFHFLYPAMKIFAVVLAMLIFVAGYRAIMSPRKGAVVWLGLTFLVVGLLDALHLMSDVSFPDLITPNSPQKSIFFWLAASVLAAVALLVYALLPVVSEFTPMSRRMALAIALTGGALIAYVGLIWSEELPSLFVAEQGFTRLKTVLGSLVVALNLVTLGVLWIRRVELGRECLMALAFAAALLAVSEFLFMFAGSVEKEGSVLLGHVYRVIAYLYLFHVTINEALSRPLEHIAQQHLREKVTLSAAPDGVLWVNQAGCILMTNKAIEALTGYTAAELVGRNIDLFLPEHLRERHAEYMRGFWAAPNSRAMGRIDLKLMRKDGQMLPVDISLGHWEDGDQLHTIAYVRDVSERAQHEESLRYQATHDELTGLPNRWLFKLQINQALARADRSGTRLAVLLMDLDHFKNVNDSFGHETGDALLVQVGERIRSVLRDNDFLARMGGDEFAVLLSDLSDVGDAVIVATKLLKVMQSSYHLKNQEVYSGASLGLTFCPDDAQDADTLMRYADMAMYQAKQAGRGGYACYSQDMDLKVHDDMKLHTRLRDALEQNRLKLFYQPQVDVNLGTIVGAEALLRWYDPELGNVSPERFIPIAEATGLILPLSTWVLETACRQIAAWEQAGTPLRVAVNFSGQQFRQPDLVQRVAATLKQTEANPKWLDIEITESVAMTQPEDARKHLDALAALGCRVALDDFGTGYSSLAYLKALPVSKLKIDKRFMDGIPHDTNDCSISHAIIAMAHGLGLTLIAEGVETEAQLDFLRKNKCEVYQGWLFAKALTAEELTQRLSCH